MHKYLWTLPGIITLLLGGLNGVSRAADPPEPPPVGQEAVGSEGAGAGKTAKDMVDYVMDLTRGVTSHGIAVMTVVTPDWKRDIKMEWWEEGEDLMLIRILSPARDEGNGTLKIGNNLWNYVYAFDETIHVPPAMMMQAWMGSDFTNDDLVHESSYVNDYEHVLEGIEEVNGERCYSILMTADPSTLVPWLTIRMYLRVDDLLPVKEEFYDDDGNLAKYMIFADFEFMYDRTIPRVMRMVPLDKEGRYTEFAYVEVEFDIELADNVFTQQNLKNP